MWIIESVMNKILFIIKDLLVLKVIVFNALYLKGLMYFGKLDESFNLAKTVYNKIQF
jgi:hypothetical protein